MTLDNATSADFYKYFSQEERVNWANDQLNAPSEDPEMTGMTVLEAEWQELKTKYPDLMVELVAPSESMNTNQIGARLVSIANIIADQESIDLKLKLLTAYADSSNKYLFDAWMETLRSGDNLGLGPSWVATGPTNIAQESPVFREDVLVNGYDPNNIPSRIANIGDDQGNSYQIIYRYIDGTPIIYDIYSMYDGNVISYPENITAN